MYYRPLRWIFFPVEIPKNQDYLLTALDYKHDNVRFR